jgi:hypothetical protein
MFEKELLAKGYGWPYMLAWTLKLTLRSSQETGSTSDV